MYSGDCKNKIAQWIQGLYMLHAAIRLIKTKPSSSKFILLIDIGGDVVKLDTLPRVVKNKQTGTINSD